MGSFTLCTAFYIDHYQLMVAGLVGERTNHWIGLIAEFLKCLNSNLSKSRGYLLLLGYQFLFGGVTQKFVDSNHVIIH